MPLPQPRPAGRDALDPTGVLTELAQLGVDLVGGYPPLVTVAAVAQHHIPGADEAMLILLEHDGGQSAVTHDDLAGLDERQHSVGWGPGLVAVEFARSVLMPNADDEDRWPEFAAGARNIGLRSSLSIPLSSTQPLDGVLTVYSRAPHAFTNASLEFAETLVEHAALALRRALTHASVADRAHGLETAMQSRAVIEQAKGIIMAARKCSAAEAFSVLARLSQSQHRKLRDVAAALTAQASAQPLPPNTKVR